MASLSKKLKVVPTKSDLKPIVMVEINPEILGLSPDKLKLAMEQGRENLPYPYNMPFLGVITSPKGVPCRRGNMTYPTILKGHGFKGPEHKARQELGSLRKDDKCSCPMADVALLALGRNPIPSEKDL
ncbi:MAG: hypothetical protein AAB597_02790 [Patescibacteria group bacterium]